MSRRWCAFWARTATGGACVLWRDAPPLAEMEAEKTWLKADVLADVDYDLLYINGESALPDALAIEAEFKRLMFC